MKSSPGDPGHGDRTRREPSDCESCRLSWSTWKIDLDQFLCEFKAPILQATVRSKRIVSDRRYSISARQRRVGGSSRTISPFSITSTRSAMSSAKLRDLFGDAIDSHARRGIRFRVRALALMIEGMDASVGYPAAAPSACGGARAIASAAGWQPDRLPAAAVHSFPKTPETLIRCRPALPFPG